MVEPFRKPNGQRGMASSRAAIVWLHLPAENGGFHPTLPAARAMRIPIGDGVRSLRTAECTAEA